MLTIRGCFGLVIDRRRDEEGGDGCWGGLWQNRFLVPSKRGNRDAVCHFPELTSASFYSNVARKSWHRGSRVRTSLDMDTPAHSVEEKVAQ